MKIALSGSVLLTFLLYQFASARGSRTAAAIWRMATILATVALAVSGLQRHPQPSGAGLIAAGLAVSVFGDLFFVLPRERFVPGLVAYLLGHLCYIGAMVSAGDTTWPLWLLLPLTLATVGLLIPIVRGMQRLGRSDLLFPACIYSGIVTVMAWGALSSGRPLLAAAGLLYYVADSVMVWHRFVRPVRFQQIIEFGCYFGAQFCFAAAVAWAA